MDQQHANQLTQTLLEEKKQIEGQIDLMSKKNPDDIADASDTLDEKAQDVTNMDERRAVEQNLELRLREIEETLAKLDAGTYGICSNCKSPIDEKRIQAMPIVQFCFDCANKVTFS